MRRLFIISILSLLPLFVGAQVHYSQVLRDAEAKNPSLLAAVKEREAKKADIESGSLIADPEVEAAYYWGDPSSIGKRWDLSFSQSFELPSVLVRRSHILNLQSQGADIDYQVLRNATLLDIQQLCADLIYYRNVSDIYARRCEAAINLAQSYQRRYDAGDCSILDYNRAQLNMADVQNQAVLANLRTDNATQDLRIIMNDESYQFSADTYEESPFEPSFEDWYEKLEANYPVLRQLDNQVSLSQQEEQLSRAKWLPEMSVGYASENIVGETFRGVTLGLTLPLWSQRHAVKAAHLQTEASQATYEAKRAELFDHLRCLYHRYEALLHNLGNLRQAYQQRNSAELLDKALQAGEISLEQYLQQLNYYNDIELQVWSTAHEMEQVYLQLHAIEL